MTGLKLIVFLTGSNSALIPLPVKFCLFKADQFTSALTWNGVS